MQSNPYGFGPAIFRPAQLAEAKREALEAVGITVGATLSELANLVAERCSPEAGRTRLRRPPRD